MTTASEQAFYGEHLCGICWLPVHAHEQDERDVELAGGEAQWPPRCCHGCGCGVEMPAGELHDKAVER